ncbi:MAG TPA: serine/threonine-protein kinase [Candidatus Dormibacteraeota bacterium]|nr:serine/threonine-protein kinase [Candidatus Dormibacteraeota bacterium]
MDKLGRYEILEELGRGAMGTVYRARDPKIGRIVAIKIIRSFGVSPTQDQEYRRRFFREAQAAGNLSHSGIVTIYDVGEDESTRTPYIVMEYIGGRTLENWLVGDIAQIPSIETSLDLVEQLAEALDYAHSQNIVHRDIKPANIIVNTEGRAKITDFGVARLTHTESTMQGQLLGTPAYMSPEQLKGDPMDGRSDLFSLGLILYWLLTGERAFSGDPTTVIAKILYQDPAPVSVSNPALGHEYDLVVSRAIAKDPAGRYQRGKELAEELSHLRAAQTPLSTSGPIAAPTYESSREPGSWTGSMPPAQEHTVILNGLPPSETDATAGAHRAWRYGKRALIYAMAAISVSVLAFLSVPIMRPVKTPALVSKLDVKQTAPLIDIPSGAIERPARAAEIAAPTIHHVLKTAATVNLQILCWYDFDAADLSVWADGNLVYETQLKLVRKRTSGYLSETVHLPAGKRTVRVRVRSNHGEYDRTKSIAAVFTEGREKTLEITCYELEKNLRLAWQDHRH